MKGGARVGKKKILDFIKIIYHNSALCYAIVLNFGRNTTSIALNSNWYNLSSMLQFNVFWKPLYMMLMN